MQTFLPFSSFEKSAKVLDRKRLGKQRVEARQIINDQWVNHPAYIMWMNYKEALKLYFNIISTEWIERGYVHNMGFFEVGQVVYPNWIGDERFHSSHRSALLFKDYSWYSQFGWNDEPRIQYFWPSYIYEYL